MNESTTNTTICRGNILSISAIIFQTGKHAEKIDFLCSKSRSSRKKVEYIDKNLYEIKSDLKTLQYDIKAIKNGISEIKNSWKKCKFYLNILYY